MAATAIYSVTIVLWKETAFPLCRAMDIIVVIIIFFIPQVVKIPGVKNYNS